MTKKRTCPKAKREKEILRDIETIKRRMKIIFITCESDNGELGEENLGRLRREFAQLGEARKKLSEELKNLWIAQPKKK